MTTANALDDWSARRMGVNRDHFDRDMIERYQLARLREILSWASQHSPFYRDHLKDISSIGTLDEIADLPFTTAADLCTDPRRFVCVSQRDIQRVVTLESSGTSGPPKRLFFTSADLERTIDFFHHGLSLMAGTGDIIGIMLPGTLPGSVGDLLVSAAKRLGAEPVVLGFIADPRMAAAAIAQHRITLLIGVPVQILAAARATRFPITMKSVLLCSDYSADGIVQELQRAWGAEIFQDWGMTEMGYGGGVQCACHDGYHLQETDFLFEIIDPESGIPLPPGTWGEVVLTTLTRRGMPLIRYRTGDMSRFLVPACGCGSPLRRLDRVIARRNTCVDLGDGVQVAMAALDDVLLGPDGLANFSARLITGTPNRLCIAAARSDGARDDTAFRQAVVAALHRVPAIRDTCRQGRLTIEVDILSGRLAFSRAKRSIHTEAAP